MPRPDLPLGRPPADRALPAGFRLAWDERTLVRAGGQVVLGGSPWRMSRLPARAQAFVAELRRRGRSGLAVQADVDRQLARVLLDRGFAHPVGRPGVPPGNAVTTVIPVLDRVDGLRALLASGTTGPTVVVDDGSVDPVPVAEVAGAFGATVVRHEQNLGPAAARNTGVRNSADGIIAFVDSDCLVDEDWPHGLAWHFDDPGVGAVAPRVMPVEGGNGALARFEEARSALDMGRHPELVRHGARLGFVPSAALLVRRTALGDGGFDEDLRLGEDVDLVWRLGEAGWQVRFDPAVTVRHRGRERLRDWARRSVEYGTSAARLEARHPGYLRPARLSAWNLTALALVAARRPAAAGLVTGASAALLARRLPDMPDRAAIAGETVVRGVLADAAQVGRLLRREWWPVGLVAMAAVPWSRTARLAAACMAVPVAMDYARERPRLDPVRYAALQWLDDAAYGTGVLASSVAGRTTLPLLPEVRLPRPASLRLRRSRARSGP